jgi:hypothetical protein
MLGSQVCTTMPSCLGEGVHNVLLENIILNYSMRKDTHAECQWLTPAILATPEAETRRTVVRSQPGQIVFETLAQKCQHKKRPME